MLLMIVSHHVILAVGIFICVVQSAMVVAIITTAVTPTDLVSTQGPTDAPCYGYICSNGLCIPGIWACDGDNDCGDNSDEQSCPMVRLVDGNNSYDGRVEVLFFGTWDTVCDDSSSENDAMVVCRQLGSPYDAPEAISNAQFGQGNEAIWLRDVLCSGSKSNSEDCCHNEWGYHNWYDNCSRCSEDAGVICYNEMPCAVICTDKNFIDCVHDGPGDYHCENCANGFNYQKEKELCVVYKYLKGEVNITSIDGVPAEYSDALSDPNSAEFEQLDTLVCTEINSALTFNTVEIYDCGVIQFRSGDIIAEFAITIDEKESTATDGEILTAITSYMTSSSSALGVDESSFKLTDICNGVTCMNEGWCVADDSFEGVCMCPVGIKGDTCDVLPSPSPSPSKGGFSPQEIFGMVIGAIACVMMTIGIIVCCMKEPSTIYPAGEQKGRKRNSRKVVRSE
ncbi:uncharacterized protein [Amphiura filiformis]|uniref:uncharacterized protein n=1 Tax=Amphiura filiformis TaxID=82378 RepID=UPI003B215DFF